MAKRKSDAEDFIPLEPGSKEWLDDKAAVMLQAMFARKEQNGLSGEKDKQPSSSSSSDGPTKKKRKKNKSGDKERADNVNDSEPSASAQTESTAPSAPTALTPAEPDSDLLTQLAAFNSSLTALLTTISKRPDAINTLPASQANFLRTIHSLSQTGLTPFLTLPPTIPPPQIPTTLPPLPPISSAELQQQALTHCSYTTSLPRTSACPTLERLEFLGDTYLHTATTRLLYDRFPLIREGTLTNMRDRLVNNTTLSEICLRYGLDKRLRLGPGAEADPHRGGKYGGRNKILADVVEAWIGASVLSAESEAAGIDRVKAWCEAIFEGYIAGFERDGLLDTPLDVGAKHAVHVKLVGSPRTGAILNYVELPRPDAPAAAASSGGKPGKAKHPARPAPGFEYKLLFTGYGLVEVELGRGGGVNKNAAMTRAAMRALARADLIDEIVRLKEKWEVEDREKERRRREDVGKGKGKEREKEKAEVEVEGGVNV